MIFNHLRTLQKLLKRNKICTIKLQSVRNCCREIKPCMDIPFVDLYENNPDTVVNIRDFCNGRKIVLFGVPGAFTPICSQKQLPAYVRRADELKKLGVDEIACISVNDPYVMCEWGKQHNAQGKVRMFADTNAAFTEAIGVVIDLPELGGIRSKRYSMVLRNSIIQYFNLEPDGTSFTDISSAESLIV